ncbi:MAG TPA: hypothetical protein VLT88_04930, partial [Desulfosarcina sp.]|nr:hypothetical protein [Desulfosarcina sp.]
MFTKGTAFHGSGSAPPARRWEIFLPGTPDDSENDLVTGVGHHNVERGFGKTPIHAGSGLMLSRFGPCERLRQHGRRLDRTQVQIALREG